MEFHLAVIGERKAVGLAPDLKAALVFGEFGHGVGGISLQLFACSQAHGLVGERLVACDLPVSVPIRPMANTASSRDCGTREMALVLFFLAVSWVVLSGDVRGSRRTG